VLRRGLQFLVALAAVGALSAPAAQAAGAPLVEATFVTNVETEAAKLRAEINTNGLPTTYHFDYISAAAYQANLAASPPRDGFSGGSRVPIAGDEPVGLEPPVQRVGGLTPGTAYMYRAVANNSEGPAIGPVRSLTTRESAAVFSLPDGRGWEMVSPVDKNGGQIAAPETLFGGGVLQAAAQGGSVTYGAAFSFGAAQGAPGASQYISRREAGGWSTENVTVPLISGGYPLETRSGVPYQLFSEDLQSGLLSNGKRCRGEATVCPVPNPSLPGSGAPSGFRDYYLRGGSGAFAALVTVPQVAGIEAEDFEVTFAGATPDLGQVILSSCSALTVDAIEVAGSGGECDPTKQNLYRHSSQGLFLVNLLPGETVGSPGAVLAAAGGAGSVSASRTYFTVGANLYVRTANQTSPVDESLGGGGEFQLAVADGAVAFFTKEEHLYRYDAAGPVVTDLTPAGGVKGVLGASADGSYVYYVTSGGIFLRHGASVVPVAAATDSGDYPPATGTARVSADGTHLVFVSSAQLTGFESLGFSEVFVYSAATGSLTCASCNTSGERPLGGATIPGAFANGDAIDTYKPRALTAGGTRLFFDSSDAIVLQDTNNSPDVYQWEAQGVGSCTMAGGCANLISSGRDGGGASFVDASADGADVFFLTEGSLVSTDPGSVDLYDARVGGGFPVPELPIPCVGDACQAVPGEPEDPTPGTIAVRPQGNPPLSIAGAKKKYKRHKKHHRKHGKHKKHQGNHKKHQRPSNQGHADGHHKGGR
jgi:hypothetical protein